MLAEDMVVCLAQDSFCPRVRTHLDLKTVRTSLVL